jgi:2-(1,2-epoxy-1,2-dihydrophenyl)acetyl-CoA isomerase
MLTNRLLNAQEALDWGIVNKVVADDQVLDAAQTLARELAAGPTLAYGAVKTLLNASFEQSLDSQMELESRAIADMSVTYDGQEGINAFLAKRKPAFKGS